MCVEFIHSKGDREQTVSLSIRGFAHGFFCPSVSFFFFAFGPVICANCAFAFTLALLLCIQLYKCIVLQLGRLDWSGVNETLNEKQNSKKDKGGSGGRGLKQEKRE